MMGIGGALFEAIHFSDGKILNPRFSEYRVPRFTDLPRMEIVLVNRNDLASAGAGETPIVCIAPALANAIFAATSKRVRGLPLLRQEMYLCRASRQVLRMLCQELWLLGAGCSGLCLLRQDMCLCRAGR